MAESRDTTVAAALAALDEIGGGHSKTLVDLRRGQRQFEEDFDRILAGFPELSEVDLARLSSRAGTGPGVAGGTAGS
jgi:hypothetical protein